MTSRLPFPTRYEGHLAEITDLLHRLTDVLDRVDDLHRLGELLDRLESRFAAFEVNQAALLRRTAGDDWYTTAEVAAMLGREEYTVREWCRLGRVRAKKLPHGRGNEGEWRISKEEVERYRKEGLLPLPRKY